MKRSPHSLPFAFLLGLLACVFGTHVSYADGAEENIIPEGWRLFVTQVPPGLISRFAGTEEDGKAGALPPDVGYGSRQFDLRKWVEETIGVTFPPKAVALFDERRSNLVCIGPREVVETVESLFMSCLEPIPQIQLGATLVAFAVHSADEIAGLPYEQVRSVAGGSWREIEHLRTTTKSGNRTVIQRLGGEVAGPAPEVRERGTTLEFEPTRAPDGETVHLNYVFHRWTGQGANAERLESTSSIDVKDGVPRIVSLWPQKAPEPSTGSDQPLRLLGLVLRVDLLSERGIPLQKIFTDQLRAKRQPEAGQPDVPVTER